MSDAWTDSYRICVVQNGGGALLTGVASGITVGYLSGLAGGGVSGVTGVLSTFVKGLPECVDQADAAHLAANPLVAGGIGAAADEGAQLAEDLVWQADFAERQAEALTEAAVLEAEALAEAAAREEGSADPQQRAEQVEQSDAATASDDAPVDPDSGMSPEEPAIATGVEGVIAAIQDYLDTLVNGGPEAEFEGHPLEGGEATGAGDGGALDEGIHPFDPGDDGTGADPEDDLPDADTYGVDSGDHDPYDFEM